MREPGVSIQFEARPSWHSATRTFVLAALSCKSGPLEAGQEPSAELFHMLVQTGQLPRCGTEVTRQGSWRQRPRRVRTRATARAQRVAQSHLSLRPKSWRTWRQAHTRWGHRGWGQTCRRCRGRSECTPCLALAARRACVCVCERHDRAEWRTQQRRAPVLGCTQNGLLSRWFWCFDTSASRRG